jgi:murein DD-endopeptidase MepM/ murein hydrolase activator NlpD
MRWNVVLATLVGLGAAAVLVTTEAPIDDPVWWYSNQTPPHLAILGPPGPLRGPVQGTITLDPADRAHIVSVLVDGRPATPNGNRVDIDSASMPDGQHQVEVVARDTSRSQNRAGASWTFISDNSPPKLSFSLDPSEGPTEGHTWLLRVTADEPIEQLQGTILDHELRLFEDGNGGYWAIAGVSPDPGYESVSVRLTASDALGNRGNTEQSWGVQHATFPEEDDELALDPNQVAPEARAQENSRLLAIYKQDDGPKLWDGPFRMPVQGPVTTEFGTRRSYEYHPGLDFGAPLGSPVIAPARGIVVFEGELPARGNVLVLDHGAGVYSTYAHVQQFDVEPGAAVSPGQRIARVGSTGFSTGPHLHWEMWVDGANVDPLDWTRRSFP